MRHRTQKASSVFCKWKPLLCSPNLSLKERMKAFGASTLSSATWLSGCWTLSKQQEQASESWCARLLSQMVGFKRNPNDDFATFWKKLHRRGHDLARVFAVSPVDLYLRTKHRLAGHFARFESCVSDVGVQKFGLVASGATRMGQDEVRWSSPAEVQRVALGIVSGAGVWVYAAGAWWRPTGSGLDCGCAEKRPVECW